MLQLHVVTLAHHLSIGKPSLPYLQITVMPTELITLLVMASVVAARARIQLFIALSSPGSVLASNAARVEQLSDLQWSLIHEMLSLGIPIDDLMPIQLAITTYVAVASWPPQILTTSLHFYSFKRDSSAHATRYEILHSTWWTQWSSPIQLCMLYFSLLRCSVGLRRVHRSLIVSSISLLCPHMHPG